MRHLTFVVSRNHLELLPALKRENRSASVEIIVDRRHGERRRRFQPTQFSDRRQEDRRILSNAYELDLLGVAVCVTD